MPAGLRFTDGHACFHMPSTRARARRSLGKQRYACYCVAQVLGAIFGALALKLALPPAMDETPFTTTGSLTFSHPFQVAPPRASSPASSGGQASGDSARPGQWRHQ